MDYVDVDIDIVIDKKFAKIIKAALSLVLGGMPLGKDVSSLAPAPELPFSQRPWGPTLPCPAPLAMVSGSPHPDWV